MKQNELCSMAMLVLYNQADLLRPPPSGQFKFDILSPILI